jgi:hypothetical protein
MFEYQKFVVKYGIKCFLLSSLKCIKNIREIEISKYNINVLVFLNIKFHYKSIKVFYLEKKKKRDKDNDV